MTTALIKQMKLSVFDNDISYLFFCCSLVSARCWNHIDQNVQRFFFFLFLVEILKDMILILIIANRLECEFSSQKRKKREKKMRSKENARNIFWRKDDKEKGVCAGEKKTHTHIHTYNRKRIICDVFRWSAFFHLFHSFVRSFGRQCCSVFFALVLMYLLLLSRFH